MWGRPRAGQELSEVKALLLEQMDKVKQGDFTDEELNAIRRNFRVRETAALESNAARVGMMMTSFVNEEEWPYTLGLLDRYDAVTRADIQRVAQQYWGEKTVWSLPWQAVSQRSQRLRRQP